MWKKHQTMLVNENRLNLADQRARQYLARQMEQFLLRRRRRQTGRVCRALQVSGQPYTRVFADNLPAPLQRSDLRVSSPRT